MALIRTGGSPSFAGAGYGIDINKSSFAAASIQLVNNVLTLQPAHVASVNIYGLGYKSVTFAGAPFASVLYDDGTVDQITSVSSFTFNAAKKPIQFAIEERSSQTVTATFST